MALNQVKHKGIILKVLKAIFSNNTISPLLGFKGGTAVYLFYNLPRFSVDIDLDLLDESKKDVVFKEVTSILKKYGEIKEAEEKSHNLFFLLSYAEKKEGDQNLKIDINLRALGSKYEVKSYLGISMKVMVQEDMSAHKMVAMVERIGRTNRDIFDVWFILENDWPINKQIVEERMSMSYKDFLKKSITSLEALTDHDILANMGELLDDKQKVWVKAKLRTDTIFLFKLALENQQ